MLCQCILELSGNKIKFKLKKSIYIYRLIECEICLKTFRLIGHSKAGSQLEGLDRTFCRVMKDIHGDLTEKSRMNITIEVSPRGKCSEIYKLELSYSAIMLSSYLSSRLNNSQWMNACRDGINTKTHLEYLLLFFLCFPFVCSKRFHSLKSFWQYHFWLAIQITPSFRSLVKSWSPTYIYNVLAFN